MRFLIVVLGFAAATLAATGGFAQAPAGDAGVAAEGATTDDPSEERAAQFVGVRGPDAERIPGGALLLSAYAVVWVLLFLYLLRMRAMQRQTADELRRLSAEIKATGGR